MPTSLDIIRSWLSGPPTLRSSLEVGFPFSTGLDEVTAVVSITQFFFLLISTLLFSQVLLFEAPGAVLFQMAGGF